MVGVKMVGSWLEFDLRNPEGMDRTFYFKDSTISKQMNVTHQEGRFIITFSTEHTETGDISSFQTKLTLGDMLRIKLYFEYLFPVINGWHAIMNPQIIENDLKSGY